MPSFLVLGNFQKMYVHEEILLRDTGNIVPQKNVLKMKRLWFVFLLSCHVAKKKKQPF